jgi:hypothetical protein
MLSLFQEVTENAMHQVAILLDDDIAEALGKAAGREAVAPADWAREAVVHRLKKEEPLAERQYRLAGQYSGEYVVLVGERVAHHTTDRLEAGRAFDQMFQDEPGASPVMVDPNLPRYPRPMIRGRAVVRRPRS